MPIKLDPIRRLADRLWADYGRTRRRVDTPLFSCERSELLIRLQVLEMVAVELDDVLREMEEGTDTE
jgi:hypothetical protein